MEGPKEFENVNGMDDLPRIKLAKLIREIENVNGSITIGLQRHPA